MVGRRYTSGFHLFVKVAILGIWATSLVVAAFVSEWIAPRLGLSTEYRILPWIPLVIIAVAIIALLENKYDASLDALAAYLYIRQTLGTAISFEEAKALSFLFAGDTDGKWYPLSETRKLPKENRKQHLFDFAASIKNQ